MLSALSTEDADRLVEALRPSEAEATPEAPAPIAEGTFGDLLRYGATSTRWGQAAALLGVGMEVLQAWNPAALQDLPGALLAAAVVAGALGAWLFGIAAAAVRYWGFRLVPHRGGMYAESGLLTRRRVDLRAGRIQQVVISATLPRRLLGASAVHIETASASAEADGTHLSSAFLPAVDAEEVGSILSRAAPSGVIPPGFHPDTDPLERPPPEALWMMVFYRVLSTLALAVPVSALAAGSGVWAGFLVWLLLPWRLAVLALDWRVAGWKILPGVIVMRTGFWNRTTFLLFREKIQSAVWWQPPEARLLGLALVQVHLAGSAIFLPPFEEKRSRSVLEDLLRIPGSSRPRPPAVPETADATDAPAIPADTLQPGGSHA